MEKSFYAIWRYVAIAAAACAAGVCIAQSIPADRNPAQNLNYRKMRPPRYPPSAIRAHVQGNVLVPVKFSLTDDNRVPVADALNLARSLDATYRKVYQPVYPPLAVAGKIEGTVDLMVNVAANGRVMSAQGNVVGLRTELDGSDARLLIDAAIDAVKRWEFNPRVANGEMLASTMDVPIEFRLSDESLAPVSSVPVGSPENALQKTVVFPPPATN